MKTVIEFLKDIYEGHKKAFNRTGAVIGALVLFIFLLNIIFPLPLHKIEDDYSRLHLDSQGNLIRIELSHSGKYRIKMGLSEISEYVKKGFIEYEDRTYFLNPAGVNPFAVVRAAFLNVKKQKIVSGGSTIAMQVAKLLETIY
jgi:penicillin-binding protein 1C